MVSGNHVKIKTFEAFAAGTSTGLTLRNTPDGGVLQLNQAGTTDGVWISPVYEVEKPFNDLIVSWNSCTPAGSHVEIFARLYLPEYDGWTDSQGHVLKGWSDWISWGKWSPLIARNCPHQQDSHERKDSGESNGWVYSYSMYGAGDSSLNVRGNLTASAFQMKAVVHAEEDCRSLPAIRLLAATWKNTLNPDWQNDCSYPETPTEPSPSVLLDTPAISQMSRDPDYANQICSATCIAMLLNGRGEDILPEDVTLMNYDYGFGGNGNWSYSCAAAGEYGYESYVSYSSFEAIRQELTKGYGVVLSVKYSNKTEDTLSYLTHGPCRTPGHLITIVGYYYSQTLGEYIYYSNDPAACCDTETARREYRESELDKCWYRRTAYFLHDRYKGAENMARRYVSAKLVPAAEHPDPWVLVAEGRQIRIPSDFLKEPREVFGNHGTICWYVEDEQVELPEDCRRVTANHKFRYDGFSITPDGFLTFEKDQLTRLLKEGRKVMFYVINNSGTMWTAECSL